MSNDHENVTPTFGSRFMNEPIPKYKLPEKSMDPKTAYHLIHDELQTQGNPTLNMASFVTTVMDEECDKLISENLGVNYIDTEVYRANLEIQNRCVAILSDLYHGNPEKTWGTQCIGSSEALLLSLLTHKRKWEEKRRAEGKPIDNPNIVMGNNVHLAWIKGAMYFELEQRIIPLKPDRFTITAAEVLERVDENTVMVVGVLGTSYTFDYDPIEEINDALVQVKRDTGLDVPLHVDGASGAFIAPFLNPELKWDFQLEQVNCINISGHKYGLVYPGIGWAIWRDEVNDIPPSLISETNVLGFVEKSFSLNFSRGGAMILAQYYNLIRLGREGYTQIQHAMRENARYLVKGVEATGKFDILNDATYTPSCCCKLKDESRYNAADLVATLAQKGWVIPAFSMPPDAQSVNAMRMNVKETFGRDMADILIGDINTAIDKLEATHAQPHHDVGDRGHHH